MNCTNLLLGTAIGDAFGAGVEFQDREWIRANVDFTMFVNARAAIPVPPEKIAVFTENYHAWDYTDDTEMTIGVLKALISGKPFTTELLVESWKAEYAQGEREKGFGRNGHGSMRWFYSGEKTMDEIRDFQRHRPNPGNAPAMRAVLLGLEPEHRINEYAKLNADATHPNINAVISSQLIARAAEYLLVRDGDPQHIVSYCTSNVEFNAEYESYLNAVDQLGTYDQLTENDFQTLCGPQPIEAPYFLPGIKGVPSDSKYTAGCVLYLLKESEDAFDALKKSVNLGGDVDSLASIAVGIMAGKMGLDSLPRFMLESVEGRPYLEALAKDYEEYRRQALKGSKSDE